VNTSLAAARQGLLSNPFATRFVRPGALSFRFREHASIDSLIEWLAVNRWRGQILGPHGSGKSTLLCALTKELSRRGRHVRTLENVLVMRGLAQAWRDSLEWNESTQIVVDGFERFAWWQRRLLFFLVGRRNCGLLVTAHRDLGIPLVYRTSPTPRIAREIVRQLLCQRSDCISDAEIMDIFHKVHGNVRELLFALYDLYEDRVS